MSIVLPPICYGLSCFIITWVDSGWCRILHILHHCEMKRVFFTPKALLLTTFSQPPLGTNPIFIDDLPVPICLITALSSRNLSIYYMMPTNFVMCVTVVVVYSLALKKAQKIGNWLKCRAYLVTRDKVCVNCWKCCCTQVLAVRLIQRAKTTNSAHYSHCSSL